MSIEKLCKAKILTETTGKKRDRVFVTDSSYVAWAVEALGFGDPSRGCSAARHQA